jgi:hypothetical protein
MKKKTLFLRVYFFLLSTYDSDESIGFVHGKYFFFIQVLDELRLFIDKKVILGEKNFRRSAARPECKFVITSIKTTQPISFSYWT